MRRKLEEAVPLWGGGAQSPSNTVWPGLRAPSVPCCILIHPPFDYNRHGQNFFWWEGAVPLWGGELGTHLTQFGEG